MFNIDEVPMYPPALVLVFIAGFLWLLYILLKNEKNKYEEEELIPDAFYIYPVTMMCVSLVCFVYQFYLGKITPEAFAPFF